MCNYKTTLLTYIDKMRLTAIRGKNIEEVLIEKIKRTCQWRYKARSKFEETTSQLL